MSNLDTVAAREAARKHNGQFGAQEHSAPEVALHLHRSRELRRLTEARELHHASARALASATVSYVAAQLREEFPGARSATFKRSWDTELRLASVEGADVSSQSAEAVAAAVLLEDVEFAGDNRITEHTGAFDMHTEYTLDLTPEVGPPATTTFLEGLSAQGRSDLDVHLSQMDGRIPSPVDTGEIRYRMEEELIDERSSIASLVAKFGSYEKAAEAVANSDKWHDFTDEAYEIVAERINDGLRSAINDLAE